MTIELFTSSECTRSGVFAVPDNRGLLRESESNDGDLANTPELRLMGREGQAARERQSKVPNAIWLSLPSLPAPP
ncbi:MAG: hypothetical protein IKP00_14570, partial [Victivallales bacterium]|nr:hypothetical protein [Victivallales bacterium]